MLNTTTLSFIGIAVILMTAIVLAILGKQFQKKGEGEKTRLLNKISFALFLVAFLGGVVVTLVRGVRDRAPGDVMTGAPAVSQPEPGKAAIGQVDSEEIEKLEQRLQDDPHDIKAYERLGHLALQQQDYQRVYDLSRSALTLDKKSVESRAHLGMILFAMQDIDNAIEIFNEALKIDPDHLETLMFKGIVLFQGKQDVVGASKTWDHFMKLAPPDDPRRRRVNMFLEMAKGSQ